MVRIADAIAKFHTFRVYESRTVPGAARAQVRENRRFSVNFGPNPGDLKGEPDGTPIASVSGADIQLFQIECSRKKGKDHGTENRCVD